MPDVENILQPELTSQHWISNSITQRQQPEENSKKKPYANVEPIQALQPVAFSDKLSQAANRLRFQAYLTENWGQMMWQQAPLSLIVANLDFFRAYSNTYGRRAGDQCLRRIAEVVVSTLKQQANLVPCHGGEEFMVVLPNTKVEEAVRVAEEIRHAVKALKIVHIDSGLGKYVTASFGVAGVVSPSKHSETMLLNAALAAVNQAKVQGRDRVILHKNSLPQIPVDQQEKIPDLQTSQVNTRSHSLVKAVTLRPDLVY